MVSVPCFVACAGTYVVTAARAGNGKLQMKNLRVWENEKTGKEEDMFEGIRYQRNRSACARAP